MQTPTRLAHLRQPPICTACADIERRGTSALKDQYQLTYAHTIHLVNAMARYYNHK